MDIYATYTHYVANMLATNDLRTFKSHPNYVYMLEHCTYSQGVGYIECIEKYFPDIELDAIISYLKKNDTVGSPQQFQFTIRGITGSCSPTSLRYVFQSLHILKHFKETGAKKIVEVGCGYGGLFLAIDHFSKHLGIPIEHYYMVDFPVVCKLIDRYLSWNQPTDFPDKTHIPHSFYACNHFGENLPDKDLFLISNYCFTEIGKELMLKYKQHLLPKVSHGYVIYQTINIPLNELDEFFQATHVEVEYPQTCSPNTPNYYVYF
jgi:hypothetical protein